MEDFFLKIQFLVTKESVRISEHGYDEIVADGLTVDEILDGVSNAEIVEYYPEFPKGKCILLFQRDSKNQPVHALWGIPKGHNSPAVLITAYRPDPTRWDDNYKHRIK